ncbi:LOW QUALITY PROTEIN: taste receptor type 2 member 10-like [Rhynchocyon petersi]
MLSATEGILIFIALFESTLGILGNGFIILINGIECVKNKKVSVIGFILTGLAISRICLIWIIVTDGFLKIFAPDIYVSTYLLEFISYLWIIIGQSNIWFTTSLSIFYFLKIANFSLYFLWLKGRLNRVLPFFMGVLLISWLLTFSQTVRIINDYRIQNRSRSWQFNINRNKFFIDQILLNLGVIFLFTLTLIISLLLISSLWRHKMRMQFNVTGLRDPNTEVHMRAVKVLMSFVIFFILYFIGIAIEISCYIIPHNKCLFIFGMTMTIICPWGHSFILILGNSKLKQASLIVLQQLKCCQKKKKKKKKSQSSMHSFEEI